MPKQFQLSPIKAIELAASRIPGAISLAQGIPSFRTPQVISDFVKAKIDEGACDKYSLTIGLAELREEIATSMSLEGYCYDPDTEIIVTAGSIEGITASILAATSPGDEVILPSPTYASYLGSLHIARCVPRFVELDEDRNFDFLIENFSKVLSKKTKAILYCSPNNPTGTIYSEEKTRELIRLTEQYGLQIIIDEVYKDFYYTDQKHFSPISIPEARDRVIRVCSFSKAYAMTGWRVGFVHGAKENISKIVKYHDAMVSCAPVVSQYGAIAALRYGHDALESFKIEFKRRRDLTIAYLDKLSQFVDYQLPKATYFVFPRIKDTVALCKNSHELAYDILKTVGLALVPGSAFGPSGESHLRISYGKELPELDEGMSRLSDYFHGTRRAIATKTIPDDKTNFKSPMRARVIEFVLGQSAKFYLKRNKPIVIGIAGIQGKTVFKRTITELLCKCKRVRSSMLSYNTQIGLPLSILGLSPPKSVFEKILFLPKLLILALFGHEQSELLILEYGIRSVNDANELVSIAPPNWLVVSGIAGGDPALNQRQAAQGIETLARTIAPNRLLYVRDDTFIQQMGLNSDPALALSLDALVGSDLRIEGDTYPVSRELIGESSVLATIAAVMLARRMFVAVEHIEEYLTADPARRSNLNNHNK